MPEGTTLNASSTIMYYALFSNKFNDFKHKFSGEFKELFTFRYERVKNRRNFNKKKS